MAKTSKKKKRKKRVEERGIAHIHATFNNTIISISNTRGDVITWSSGGRVGFKGTRKSTPHAAQLAARQVGREVTAMGMRRIEVRTKGPGPGRESAIRTLQSVGLEVTRIKDVTPLPHNGCRPKKRRRI